MFNKILGRLSQRQAPASRPYGKVGGGILLPILAFFGWKYRDRIRDAYNNARGRATTTTPGYGRGV